MNGAGIKLRLGIGRAFGASQRKCGIGTHGYSLRHHPWFNPIIRRVDQILLSPEMPLDGLNRSAPERQLDLFQFAARRPAQLRARPAIMPDQDATKWLGVYGMPADSRLAGRVLRHSPPSRRTCYERNSRSET